MTQNIKTIALAALLACGLPAVAAPIQLKFEGLSVTTTNASGAKSTPDVRVDNFYDGGSSKSTGVPSVKVVEAPVDQDFGTVFIGPAIVTTASDAFGDGSFKSSRILRISGVESDSPALGSGALYVDGPEDGLATLIIDPDVDFDTGVSFFYSGGPLDIVITTTDGKLLGSSPFSFVTPTDTRCADDTNLFCTWAEASFAFTGKARSVTFYGATGSFLIDNITLGALDPLNPVDPGVPPIPEPSTYALMALGLAAVGYTARRRKQRG